MVVEGGGHGAPRGPRTIGILGGTGKEGIGLATRLSKAGHAVVLGSRDAERAEEKARALAAPGGDVRGATNRDAAARADLIIVAVPFSAHAALLGELKDVLQRKIVIDAVVPLDFAARHPYAPPQEGSAAEQAQALLGAGAAVVAALHHIAAHDLSSLDRPIEGDVLCAGDDAAAKATVFGLVRDLGARPVDAGPLRSAPVLEALTSVLIEINKRHKTRSSGLRITGI